MRKSLDLIPKPDPDGPDVRALQSGDDSALDRLIARHEEGVFRFFASSLNDREDARELAQEVFVRAYFARGQFDGKGTFKAWLYRIAVNLLKDKIKSKGHRKTSLTSSLDSPTAGDSESMQGPVIESMVSRTTPSDAAVHRETLLRVRECIAKLPPEFRLAFVLGVVDQRSYQECAEILGLTVKAVEMRIYKARKLLQDELRAFVEGS